MRFAFLTAALIVGLPLAADAEGWLCRWHPGTTRVDYATFEPKDAADTSVRVLLQGALLVDPAGRFPSFAPVAKDAPARQSEPLACHDVGAETIDGMLELTFARRVRMGIEYTLGRCQLFYRCLGGAAEGTPPLRLDGPSGGHAASGDALPRAK
jgi:hypothetical protein